jgi:3-hydroxybutyryl-CoA dehydrogenase
MTMSDFERVGVIGCGVMGSGIAEVFARAGCSVVVREVSDEALDAGRARIERSLARATRGGKIEEAAASLALARIAYTTEFAPMGDRELVIEAVAEIEALKAEVFAALDAVVEDRAAVFASNTSSIPIVRLAVATRRPAQVLGLHFFNPVPVMALVEVIPTLLTSEETTRRARACVRDRLGKHVVEAQDRAGFVVNALLVPYLLAAIRMCEAGVASAVDIDAGMREGCAHPMGPLALADFIGLDTLASVADVLYDEHRDPSFVAPPLLRRMVDAGQLGRKSGAGFHHYEDR